MNDIRSRHRHWSASTAALAALCACLAGCGGKEGAGGGQAAANPAPAGGAAPAASAAAPAAATAAAAPAGQQVFQRCAVCHQTTGLGIAGSFPPLAGSEWATAANPSLPIRIVLHGLQGTVTVNNQRFANAMPAFGTGQPLSDAEVAAVLTYVRSSWGNAASAVTAEQVAAERTATASHTGMWSATELAPLLKSPAH
ncbi:MAG TPA: cytochrome c [Gemmatimonadales bacterium]|nr:cytochrome c [Gemmatimonadales bacterium]